MKDKIRLEDIFTAVMAGTYSYAALKLISQDNTVASVGGVATAGVVIEHNLNKRSKNTTNEVQESWPIQIYLIFTHMMYTIMQ